MTQNRVYTIELYAASVVPGAVGDCSIDIKNENRTALLKSVTFDIRIRLAAAPWTLLPLAMNTTQAFDLHIVALPLGNLHSQIFAPTGTGDAYIATTGARFTMFTPGQIKFESFFIRSTLRFNLAYQNWDALLNYQYGASIIAEIQDIDL